MHVNILSETMEIYKIEYAESDNDWSYSYDGKFIVKGNAATNPITNPQNFINVLFLPVTPVKPRNKSMDLTYKAFLPAFKVSLVVDFDCMEKKDYGDILQYNLELTNSSEEAWILFNKDYLKKEVNQNVFDSLLEDINSISRN